MNLKFEIDKEQEKLLMKWKRAIKKKHGKYGLFTYSFSPYGMGTGVKVYSHLDDDTIDLSDVELW